MKKILIIALTCIGLTIKANEGFEEVCKATFLNNLPVELIAELKKYSLGDILDEIGTAKNYVDAKNKIINLYKQPLVASIFEKDRYLGKIIFAVCKRAIEAKFYPEISPLGVAAAIPAAQLWAQNNYSLEREVYDAVMHGNLDSLKSLKERKVNLRMLL